MPGQTSTFKVNLQQLADAITSVGKSATVIDGCTKQINMTMQTTVDPNWATPTEITFARVQQVCTDQMANLNALLSEMVARMQATYDNYKSAESTNAGNFNTGAGGH